MRERGRLAGRPDPVGPWGDGAPPPVPQRSMIWFRPLVDRLAFAALALIAPLPARANGAFPDEFSIHFPANAPRRIFMGANFGLLVSEDDGLSWRYSCEPWVVAGSNAAVGSANVSFFRVTADGALLANAINLTRSSDMACTWPISTGSIAGQLVADFFP